MDRDFTPDIRENEPTANREMERDSRPREPRKDRDDRYSITDRQRETIVDIGKFRTVAVEDLTNHKYDGKSAVLREDLRSMLSQGIHCAAADCSCRQRPSQAHGSGADKGRKEAC